MAYNPHATTSEDRFPSGIVFFGASSTKPMLDSSSAFIIDEENNSLAIADGYYLGSQSYRQLLHLASDGTATFASGVIIDGNLTVNGDVVTVNTEQILVEDNVITLSSGDYADPSQDAGIEIYRGSGTHDIMSLLWNETSDKWTFTDTSGTYDLVGAYLSQELRYKRLDGNYNDFANIPNDGLSNSSITITAGTGLKTGGTVSLGGTGVLDIDLNDLPTGAIANGDSIAFIDANDSNLTKKESIADIATLFAGDGLTATNSVINVVGGTGITASANSLDIDATLITSQTAVNDYVECGANSVFLFFDPDNPSGLKKIDLDQLADSLLFNAGSDLMSGIYVGEGINTILLQNNDFLYFSDSTEIDVNLSTTSKTFTFALKPNSIANGKLANDDVTVNAGSGLANGGSVSLGNSIRVDLDIAGQTELSAAPDAALDYLLIYDNDAASVKKINRNNFVSGLGTMNNFVLEDGDGTEVTITNAKEIKFVEGTGIDINWTDTDNGTDADPYDLTFNVTNVPNAALQNSSITVSGDSGSYSVSLGGGFKIAGGTGLDTSTPGGDVVQIDLDISEYSTVTPANGDKLLTLDSNGTTEQLTDISALATLFAGTGLAASNSVISIDLSEYSTAAVGAGDSFLMLDSNGSTEQRSTVDQLGTYMAGTNITNTAGVLSVPNTTIEGVVFVDENFVDSTTIDFTTSGGTSVTAIVKDASITEAKRDRTVVEMISTATIATTTDIVLASNTITLTLPAGVDGKIVRVKNIGTGTVTVSSSSLIDGAGSKILYYQNESMTFVYYGTGSTWHVI
jgi:hypothetical protein